MVGTFSGKKSLKALSNKVFRFIQQTPINNYKDRQTYYGALNLLEPDLILEKYPKGLAKSDWKITCELFAPYAPEENPLEAIWFQLKNLLRRFYRFGKNFKIINLLFEFLPNIIFSNLLT